MKGNGRGEDTLCCEVRLETGSLGKEGEDGNIKSDLRGETGILALTHKNQVGRGKERQRQRQREKKKTRRQTERNR